MTDISLVKENVFLIRNKWSPGRVFEVSPGIINECGKDIIALLEAYDRIEKEVEELHKFLSPEAIDIREKMSKEISVLKAQLSAADKMAEEARVVNISATAENLAALEHTRRDYQQAKDSQ